MICIFCISNSVSHNLIRWLTRLISLCIFAGSYFMKLTVRGPVGRVGGRVLALVEMGRGSALVHALIRPHCMEEITAMEILRNLRYVI